MEGGGCKDTSVAVVSLTTARPGACTTFYACATERRAAGRDRPAPDRASLLAGEASLWLTLFKASSKFHLATYRELYTRVPLISSRSRAT